MKDESPHPLVPADAGTQPSPHRTSVQFGKVWIPASERVKKTAEGYEAPQPAHPRGRGEPAFAHRNVHAVWQNLDSRVRGNERMWQILHMLVRGDERGETLRVVGHGPSPHECRAARWFPT